MQNGSVEIHQPTRFYKKVLLSYFLLFIFAVKGKTKTCQ